jgi:hypothetical protein
MALQEAILAAQYGCTIDPFTYEVDLTPATASINTTGQFVVQSDAAFAIVQTAVIVMSTANAGVAGLQPFASGVDASQLPFLVSFTDQGSGRSLQSNPVPMDSIFGDARRPYKWTTPKILEANSTFSITVQNLSATDRNVRMSFMGYKVFGNVGNFVAKIKNQ